MDATELLLLGYAKTLKTFTPRRQPITKMKNAQIFMEQETEQEKKSARISVRSFSSFIYGKQVPESSKHILRFT
jgi:hypothetical protein